MGVQVLFEYTIVDREYCIHPQEIYIDLSKSIIYGVKSIRVWDDHCKGFIEQVAFYVSYNGREYGSLNLEWSPGIRPCGQPTGDDFMYFEDIFEDVFE